jgi:hypothetical protein
MNMLGYLNKINIFRERPTSPKINYKKRSQNFTRSSRLPDAKNTRLSERIFLRGETAITPLNARLKPVTTLDFQHTRLESVRETLRQSPVPLTMTVTTTCIASLVRSPSSFQPARVWTQPISHVAKTPNVSITASVGIQLLNLVLWIIINLTTRKRVSPSNACQSLVRVSESSLDGVGLLLIRKNRTLKHLALPIWWWMANTATLD